MMYCRELWDGPRAGTDGAVEFTGVDEVGVLPVETEWSVHFPSSVLHN